MIADNANLSKEQQKHISCAKCLGKLKFNSLLSKSTRFHRYICAKYLCLGIKADRRKTDESTKNYSSNSENLKSF